LANELGVHVTVAFIPWNHWRTRRNRLRTLQDHPAAFSICAHGCDHTSKEFRSQDYNDLFQRSHLAAKRMDLHHERTGMNWDRLMVCPREEYTEPALRALAATGQFLGLVNTGCIPRDLNSQIVKGSDLLLPAQDAFYGFPIFKRHYWSSASVFAMATFLGKPVILVEHHDFFRDDNRALKHFVDEIKANCPKLRWSGLADLARHTCSRRRTGPGKFEVRFFTDDFQMDNPDAEPRSVRFLRRLPTETVVESVTVNGNIISHSREGEFICFEARVAGHATARVRLQRTLNSFPPASPPHWSYGAKVAVRRLTSEIRDNWLSRSPIVLKWANRMVKVVRGQKPMPK